MNWPYELQIGWRYLRSGRGARRNRFISFISGASMLGVALGVAALIIVLSVMNGFQREVRDRMLSVVPHIALYAHDTPALPDWQGLAGELRAHPQVAGVAPFVIGQALVARGDEMRGVRLRGLSPADEPEVTPLAAALRDSVLRGLQPGARGVVLGAELARTLRVQPGDQVTLVLQPTAGQQGGQPRLQPMTVVGTFHAGHYEYDSSLAWLHIADAAELLQLPGPNGLQLRLKDLDRAPQVTQELARTLSQPASLVDWTRTNANWFAALQLQKRMLSLILTLIVAVAAFNLVSTLVMTVTDKRADIAILRTLGASPASVMRIFVVQGSLSGGLGTLAGLVGGLAVALNVDVLVPAIERLLGAKLLPSSIYLIDSMPSDPRVADIVPIVVVSLLLSFLATLYPSWRASRLHPAEALRYE